MKSNCQNKSRNSSVELIKIFAILMIVLSHSTPDYADKTSESYVNLSCASSNLQILIAVIIGILGQVGNCIFIVCSSYFLVDCYHVNTKKILSVIIDTVLISIIFLLIFMVCGYELELKEIIKQLFPILFQNNWYITAYIIMLFICPYINIILKFAETKKLVFLVSVLTFFYMLVDSVYPEAYFCNKLISFISIYTLVGFIKKYHNDYMIKITKTNLSVLIIFGLLLLAIISFNYIGLHISIIGIRLASIFRFNNPIIVAFCIILLYSCLNKHFVVKQINNLSGISLYIYIIHENALVADKIKPLYWEFVFDHFTYKCLIVLILALAFISLLISCIGGFVYINTIKKLSQSFAYFIDKKFKVIFDKTYNNQ